MQKIKIYGIGNPLIDVVTQVTDKDLEILELNKGIMHLIDIQQREKIIDYISDKDISYSCGGSCPNTMISMASFSVSTALSGKIGSVPYGDIYEKRLEKTGTISDLSRDNGSTGSSIILVSPDSERTMNTFLGSNREYAVDNLNKDLLTQADYLYFTGYMWDTETQKQAVRNAIAIAKEQGISVVFDVADPFAVKRYKDDFISLIADSVDILFANAEEAKILWQNDALLDNIDNLKDLTKVAVIKDGANGSYLIDSGSVEKIPVCPAEKVLDTTGAGDMYAAGFLIGICKGFTFQKSARLASFLASRIIQQYGAQFTDTMHTEISSHLKNSTWDYK